MTDGGTAYAKLDRLIAEAEQIFLLLTEAMIVLEQQGTLTDEVRQQVFEQADRLRALRRERAQLGTAPLREAGQSTPPDPNQWRRMLNRLPPVVSIIFQTPRSGCLGAGRACPGSRSGCRS